ncbi:nodulation-signaling pathway 2 protein-like [Quillaja saponaria]|uniref:Nodulation-signaling pathway 2 protein-like n=1 Tax=Quillaja saponaria TaxID=32244 RepID=A0AAD7PCQ0_QUISA|nr:nodulation-signaling pathway 2 protein-like [Quillaja saponaria]
MQHEFVQASWPSFDATGSGFDQVELYDFNLDGPFTEDVCEISSMPFCSAMFLNDSVQNPLDNYDSFQLPSLIMEDFPMEFDEFEFDEFEPIFIDGVEGMSSCLEESEGSFPSQQLSTEGEDDWSPSPSMISELSSNQPSLTLPAEDMQLDSQLIVPHLLKGYGEALGKEQMELAKVILGCINEKVGPVGDSLERVAFNLSQDIGNQGHYLRQEALKNFVPAFKTFLQTFPYGKFAHLTAISAILGAIPDDADIIHIVDFDLSEGVQWPPMIEAIAHRNKMLKLTSIKRWEKYSDFDLAPWSFEETKRQLYEQASSSGLKLKVEEKAIEDLVTELKKMKKRGGEREYFVFNCMVGLPHMGRGRGRRHVMEFLNLAQDFINSGNRGVVIFGDGDACEKLKNCSDFGSFFDGHLVHYQALLESMEMNFPVHLAEARTTMECLFVAPYVSSLAWLSKWKEIQEGCQLQAEIGLQGHKFSKKILMEVKEMVNERESSYGVSIEGLNGNEIVLDWRGIPLVRVSTWGT